MKRLRARIVAAVNEFVWRWYWLPIVPATLLALAGCALILNWLFFDKSPPVGLVSQAAVRTAVGPLHAGDPLIIRRSYCATSQVVILARREVIGAVNYRLPDVSALLEPGCVDHLEEVELPRGLPPGSYGLRASFQYRMNPIRTETVELPVVPFAIIDGRGAGARAVRQ